MVVFAKFYRQYPRAYFLILLSTRGVLPKPIRPNDPKYRRSVDILVRQLELEHSQEVVKTALLRSALALTTPTRDKEAFDSMVENYRRAVAAFDRSYFPWREPDEEKLSKVQVLSEIWEHKYGRRGDPETERRIRATVAALEAD